MKTNSKFILVLLLCLSIGFSSCEKEYLEETPTDSISVSTATGTADNLVLIINGIHRSLYLRYQDSQGKGGIGALMIQNEVLGDDYVMTARANSWFINAYQWNDHTSETDSDDLFPYRTYYRIIRNANSVINAENVKGSTTIVKQAKGQALYYRAWSYFQLVQLYGERYEAGVSNTQLGVPIRLDVNSEPLARASVEDVYTQVNQDLTDAIIALDGYVRTHKSHISKTVALGLKARVALVQGNNIDAATLAVKARASYNLMSFSDYFNNFSNYESDEWMWGSHIQEDHSLYYANYGAYISRNFSSSNIKANPKAINSTLYHTIPTSDVRSRIFDPTGQHNNLPVGVSLSAIFTKKPYTSQKFIAAGEGDSRMDIPYMRVSEMYLIEAEAKARLGSDDVGAANALFQLAKVRNPSYTLSTNTGTALLDEILLQRRWELWGEGFRFYDLKRTNKELNRNGANHTPSLAVVLEVPAGDKRWQWLIPQSAINANPLLVQNPL